MNIDDLLDLVNKAISLANFDRKRFSVKAVKSILGEPQIDLHATTLFFFPEPGRFLNNYQPIRLEDVSDRVAAGQLLDVVEGAVQMLKWRVEEAETKA